MAGSSIESKESTDLSAAEYVVNKLKATYNCKVIQNVGDFAFVVTAKLGDEDAAASIKFQLEGDYPTTSPTMRLVVPGAPEEALLSIEKQLHSLLSDPETSGDLCNVVQSAKDWYISISEELSGDEKTPTGTKKKKEKRKQRDSENSIKESKKVSMKTAEDVIKRIQWDADFPKENFIVGYVDRFLGVVEKPFSAFAWVDLSTVDYYTLAIPQHRIEYFKYRTVKVWEKSKRLDFIFGSTGNPAKIHDIIRSEDDAAENADSTPVPNPATAYDNDNSDDELELELGSITSLSFQARAELERPNYFLCLRITEPTLVEKVREIQQHILRMEPRYQDCIIPEACLHITISCIGLYDSEMVSQCCRVLEEHESDIKSAVPSEGLELTFDGVNNFQNRVVYAQVQTNELLLGFVRYVNELLDSSSIPVRNQYTYVPHMTLMKVTRPVSREMKSKLVDPCVYSKFSDTFLGSQAVDRMYLCSMDALRQPNGFYLSPHHVPLCN